LSRQFRHLCDGIHRDEPAVRCLSADVHTARRQGAVNADPIRLTRNDEEAVAGAVRVCQKCRCGIRHGLARVTELDKMLGNLSTVADALRGRHKTILALRIRTRQLIGCYRRAYQTAKTAACTSDVNSGC